MMKLHIAGRYQT